MALSAGVKPKPFYLEGNYAPVDREVTGENLAVRGAIPPELRGRYFRNGPNPVSANPPHWFFGDGMIHGIAIEDGAVRWYRNRWVKTRALGESALVISETGEVDRTVGVANTHVVGHAGRIFALVETSYPTELSTELDTLGVCDFDGKLRTAMTAHPKICPRTGELHFFGYGFTPPYLTYHVLDAGGRLIRSEEIAVPGSTMIHDFAITDRNVIFMDLPVCFDVERALRGVLPYAWSDDYGARVGVMPRGGRNADVRWYDVEPCYVFHPMNAHEDDEGCVIVDVARYDSLWRDSDQRFDEARLHRWILDPVSGRASEQPLDDRGIEFPRIDERLTGSAHRFGYAVRNPGGGESQAATALVKYDLQTGRGLEHEFGRGRMPGEGVFVPAGARAGEDEGWILTLVYDAADDATDFIVLDAAHFDAPPLAEVRLPQRVPFGFHGSWIAD